MKYELNNFASDTKRKTKKNNKHKSKTPKFMYIVAAVFAVAVVAFMLFFIFGTSAPIENTWLHKTDSGFECYYTFYEESQGNKLEITIGSDHFFCSYTTDGDKLTTSYDNNSIYPDNLLGEYSFEVKEENGKEVLVLTGFDDKKTTLQQVQKPSDSDFLKPYQDYKIDEDIVGTWELKYDLGKMQLEVDDDGTLVLNLFDIEYQHYVYTVSDGTIKMSFFKDKLNEFNEQYRLVDGKLEFLGIPWERVK